MDTNTTLPNDQTLDGTKDNDNNYNKADPSTAYFDFSPVNSTTFLIHEKDKFEEHPFIYVKVYENIPVVVLSDTGCGSGTNQQSKSRNLKEFLENQPVPANHGEPLNPRDSTGKATKKYFIICTHCHYDHILGIEQFHDESAEIIASKAGQPFIETDLPEHSLCKSLNISTPRYQVTQWVGDHGTLSYDGNDLGIEVIHTPGHTPDELAWYDKEERHLYVGDTFYERVAKDKSYEQAILFPNEGNIVDYIKSLDKLLKFIDAKNTDDDAHKGPIRIGCGHVTASVEAKNILLAVKKLFVNILEDKVPVVKREEKRGEQFLTWQEAGEPRFSVAAPEKIMIDARQSMTGK